MSRSRRGKKAGEDAERLLQEAFGVSEDQLLKDFILAQTEVKDSDIPPEPEDGFERLMAKLEAEVGTSPESEKESSSENIIKLHEEVRKPRRLKTIVKVSVAAAAIAVMVVAMGISAKREYRYVVRERDSLRNEIVLNNIEAAPGEDELDRTYIEIARKTKIHVMKLAYIPRNLEYVKADIGETRAVIYFRYGKYKVKLVQQIGDVGNSMSVVSDRKKETHVYNELLRENINIDRASIENGKIEYSSYYVKGNSYYQISGVMPQREFCKIIKNLYLEEY